MPTLPKGTRFIVPKSGFKKYQAILPLQGGKIKKVNFGDRRYQHYKDSVPKSMGGGKWSKSDHGDSARRKNYRSRHGALKCKDGKTCVEVKYSPAWFSYYYLW